MQKMKKLKTIIKLQAVVVIYTFASIFSKLASGEAFLSGQFILFLGLELVMLFLYALLWQQMIKKFDLSVAYANRAMALLWSAIWAVVLFHEKLDGKQIAGILLVVLGTVIVNTDNGNKAEDKEENAS